MLGFILLIIAIDSYVRKQKRRSLFILLLMVSGFFGLMPGGLVGVKSDDLLFVFTVIICLYSTFTESVIIDKDEKVQKYVKLLFVFLILSALFSLIHYGFSYFQILQGGRSLFIFLSYFFLRKTRKEDVVWLFKWMYYLTLISSVLYILEVATGLPFLPSAWGIKTVLIDKSTGINRFYNSPIYLPLFIYVSILFPELIKRYKYAKISPYVFCLAQLATLGRVEISTVAMILLIGFYLKGQGSRLVKYAIIGGFCLIPFANIIANRFAHGNAEKSLVESVYNGDIVAMATTGDMTITENTMIYRFAWIYERAEYLANRPFLENVFGLGMITDSQESTVRSLYRFNIGLQDEDGDIAMLYTPDLSYGNILVQFGYLGGYLYMCIWFSLVSYFYKNRKLSPYAFVFFLLSLGYLFRSFSGSTISHTSSLCIFFLFMAIIPQLKQKSIIQK